MGRGLEKGFNLCRRGHWQALRCPARRMEKAVDAGRTLLFPSFLCGLVGPPQVTVGVQKREEGLEGCVEKSEGSLGVGDLGLCPFC